MPNQEPQITRLLEDMQAGDSDAMNAIMPLIYDDLYKRAHNFLSHERANHTLNTTALVHEAYLVHGACKRVGRIDEAVNPELASGGTETLSVFHDKDAVD